MSLTPCQERRLRRIAEHLSVTDPALARRLWAPRQEFGPRPLLVLMVVLAVTTAGLVPLAVGVASASSTWLVAGVLTATFGVPAGTVTTLERARHLTRRGEQQVDETASTLVNRAPLAEDPRP